MRLSSAFGNLCFLALLSGVAVGCSSSDDGGNASPAGAGTGGSGQGGGSAGAGTGGKAGAATTGAGGNAGHGGAGNGGAGKGGTGGSGVAGGAGKGGSAGSAGHGGVGGSPAGQGGAAGVGGAAGHGGVGTGGKAGSSGIGGAAGLGGMSGMGGSGGSSSCTKDADCTAKPPVTVPANCAVAACDKASKQCEFVAKDGDGDGHGTDKCKAPDGTPIVVGDDCDDKDKLSFPTAWDGPKGDGNPDRCDGIDEDCSGTADDGALMSGTTCTCAPGDVDTMCDMDSGGQPIVFPTGTPLGACAHGKRTCLQNGTWGPCIGAIGPKSEKCNMVDDDCNGVIDDGPPPDKVPLDAVYWAYDGDNDIHALIPGTGGYQPVRSCDFLPPSVAPLSCTTGSFDNCTLGTTAAECCPPNGWKLASAIPADDCNDENAKMNPAQPQECLGLDNHCDGVVDKGCVCKPGAVDSQCSEVNGAPVTWPLGAPAGSCKYGSRQCESTGKAWSACGGGIAPKAGDDCSIPGNDDNCNGVPNEGCGCTGTQTQPCGSTTGSCEAGTQTCTPGGTWGACVGGVTPKSNDSCDPGDDDNCNGVPNEGCACVNGAACGSAATCNNGTWSGCLSNGTLGVCSGGTAQGTVGNACNVQGIAVGGCLASGRLACPTSGSPESCNPVDATIGTAAFHTSIAPSSPASLDWNCDGSVETRFTPAGGTFHAYDTASAPCPDLVAKAKAYCASATPFGQFGCPYNDINFYVCVDSNDPYYDPALDYACLTSGVLFGCSWNAVKNACEAAPYVGGNYNYTMECH